MEKAFAKAYDGSVNLRIITGAVFVTYITFGTACFMQMNQEMASADMGVHDMAAMDHGGASDVSSAPCDMCYAEPLPASVFDAIGPVLFASLPHALTETSFADTWRPVAYAPPELPPPIPVRTVVLRN